MEPSETTPAVAERLFGDRIDIVRAYREALATDGVEWGLIGPREVSRLWDRHILNSAVLGELIADRARVVDVGSGAGLPGIPLALARPDLRVTLVEPLLRRTKFLAQFVDRHRLSVTVVRGRAEQPGVVKEAGGADVVVSRAVAPLGKLAQWCLPLVHEHGTMLAIKGSSAAEELEHEQDALVAAGAGDVEIVVCGADLLSTPTTVVRAVRLSRKQRRR